MKRCASALVMMASVGCISHAYAAANGDKSSARDVRTARLAVAKYAHCVVNKNDQVAWRAIINQVSNERLNGQYRRLADPDCARKASYDKDKLSFYGLKFPVGTILPALADAIVKRDLATRPAMDFSSVKTLDHKWDGPGKGDTPPTNKALQEDWDHALARSFLARYSECVVRVRPAAVRDLLLSKEGSNQEGAAFAELRTPLGTCFPPGKTITFGREQLRDSMALNYVRLAAAASPDLPPVKDD